jgi:hypothetical protein
MSLTKDDVKKFETTKVDIEIRTEFIINKCLKIFFGKEIPHKWEKMNFRPTWMYKKFTEHYFYDVNIASSKSLMLSVSDDDFVMSCKYFVFPIRWLWEDFEDEAKAIIAKYKEEEQKIDDKNKIKDKKNKDLIKAALKKLTPEEREALKCRV